MIYRISKVIQELDVDSLDVLRVYASIWNFLADVGSSRPAQIQSSFTYGFLIIVWCLSYTAVSVLNPHELPGGLELMLLGGGILCLCSLTNCTSAMGRARPFSDSAWFRLPLIGAVTAHDIVTVVAKPYLSAGQRLRAARERVGLSTRDVAAQEQAIAPSRSTTRRSTYSHGWLTDMEQGKIQAGAVQAVRFDVIYHKSCSEIASYFGLRIADLNRDRALIGMPEPACWIWRTRRSLSESDAAGGVQAGVPLREDQPARRWSKNEMGFRLSCCSISIFESRCTGTSAWKIALFIR